MTTILSYLKKIDNFVTKHINYYGDNYLIYHLKIIINILCFGGINRIIHKIYILSKIHYIENIIYYLDFNDYFIIIMILFIKTVVIFLLNLKIAHIFANLITHNNIEKLKILLKSYNTNYLINHIKYSFLYDAIVCNNYKITKLFLKFGHNPNSFIVENKRKYSIFQLACKYNNLEIIKLLLKYGANPNTIDTKRYCIPLLIAIYKKNPKLLRLLIKYGVNIEKQHIFNPINIALKRKSKKIMKILNNKIKNRINYYYLKQINIKYYDINLNLQIYEYL